MTPIQTAFHHAYWISINALYPGHPLLGPTDRMMYSTHERTPVQYFHLPGSNLVKFATHLPRKRLLLLSVEIWEWNGIDLPILRRKDSTC
jgi:hypothetical protein